MKGFLRIRTTRVFLDAMVSFYSFYPTGMNDRNTYWAIRLFICRLYTTMESPCAFLIEYTTFKVTQRLLHFSFEFDKQSWLKDARIVHIDCHTSSCLTKIYE